MEGGGEESPTSFKGTRGGPAAMLADLVPGWMRRFAFASIAVCSICCAWRLVFAPMDGDLGPIWISAGGGGLEAWEMSAEATFQRSYRLSKNLGEMDMLLPVDANQSAFFC